jgi:hypothetical protein
VLRVIPPLAAALLVLAAPASAAPDDLTSSRHLWATLNVCDTAKSPDGVGVRASMPGSGKRGQTMWMRFRLQYRDRERGGWRTVDDSGLVKVGRHARYKARQSGWMFALEVPAERSYRVRGLVTFQWRRAGRVVTSTSERTTAGHHVSVSDPDGYSEASCVVSG